MLVFCQVLMPNVSLIGHLVGILGAYLYAHGCFAYLLLPVPATEFVERRLLAPTKLLEHPAYIALVLPTSTSSEPSSSSSSLGAGGVWSRVSALGAAGGGGGGEG
mmetsp:Transcript_12787/g.30165  ORF Transcript_12787/g.30165 Transcript_12787/m.30165 type:complete len:105 (-) Transcript_12787:3-317(-)